MDRRAVDAFLASAEGALADRATGPDAMRWAAPGGDSRATQSGIVTALQFEAARREMERAIGLIPDLQAAFREIIRAAAPASARMTLDGSPFLHHTAPVTRPRPHRDGTP